MELTTLFVIIWIHFIADFVLQYNNMAMNKWNNIKWLSFHCIVYGIPFLYFGWKFALVTSVLHFVVDFTSSKITHHIYGTKKKYIGSLL